MKTMNLIVGLVSVLGAVSCYAMGVFGTDVPVLKGLWFVGGMVNGAIGVNNVMEACFGKGGLVCEVFPANDDRLEPEADMRSTKRNIDGKLLRYRDWRAEVMRLADERAVPDSVLDEVHEAMLRDGWDKGEYPAKFFDSVVACFGEPETEMKPEDKVRETYTNAELESRRMSDGSGERPAYRVRVRVAGGFRSTAWHWTAEEAWAEAAGWAGVG